MSPVLFVIIIFIAVGISMAIYMSTSNDQDQRLRQVASIEISADDTFVSSWDGSFVALNYKTRKLLVGKKEQRSLYNFDQILKVDLLRDDNVITNTNINHRERLDAVITLPHRQLMQWD